MDSDGFVRFISVNMFSCVGEGGTGECTELISLSIDPVARHKRKANKQNNRLLPCTVIWVSMSTGS